MKHHRVYTEQALSSGQSLVLESEPSRHLLKALRLKPGASVTLFNGDGFNYPATLTHGDKNHANLSIQDQTDFEPAPPFKIHLALGVSKGERMDYAIQKAVELGVTHITPLITEYTVVRISTDRQQKRLNHWRKIIIAACEQSGRRRLPHCGETIKFDNWLEENTAPCIILDPRSEQTMHQLQPPEQAIALLVGPEGGISSTEHEQAIQRGCIPVQLGPRILRTETAPLAAIAAIQTLWGDFN